MINIPGIIDNITVTTSTTYTTGPKWNFCPFDGKKLEDGWKYCPDCGQYMIQTTPWQGAYTYPTYGQTAQPIVTATPNSANVS